MRLPRVRFTVRRMMIGIAVVALSIAWVAERHRTKCHEYADLYASGEISARNYLARLESCDAHCYLGKGAACERCVRMAGSKSPYQRAQEVRDLITEVVRRKQIFQRASYRPWLPVPPLCPPLDCGTPEV